MKSTSLAVKSLIAFACLVSQPAAWAADNSSYTWKQDVALNCSTCDTSLKEVIQDASGNAIAVWAANNNGVLSIRTARFDAVTQSWSTPQWLAAVKPDNLQLGIDKYGNVKAAWLVGGAFYMAQFHASSRTWTSPTLVFRGSVLPGGRSSFAVDPEGNAYFTYLRVTGATTADGSPVHAVAVFRYTAASATWKGMTVDSTAAEQAFNPSIAVDSAGNAIVLWGVRVSGSDGQFRGNIKVSRYRPVNGYWGHVRVLASHGGAFDPQVALRPNGRAMASWGVTLNGSNDIHVRQYDPIESLWGSTTTFGLKSADPAYGLNLALDRFGNGYVAWAENQRGQLLRRYNVGTNAWSAILAYDDGADFSMPDVAVDTSGNAVHTFSNNALSGTTNAVRYNAATAAWGAPVGINNSGEQGESAKVAMGGDSTAVAIWSQPSGQFLNGVPIRNLNANRLAP